jgi:hypothetical protein
MRTIERIASVMESKGDEGNHGDNVIARTGASDA